MDFKQLQSFVTVVRCGSFSRAAEKLFLSQPTISAHIQSLEQELNRKLLIRTTRNLELTPKGRIVFDHAVSILDLRDRMITECSETGSQIIQLGAANIAASYILPQVLPAFGRLHPEAWFRIHQSDNAGVIQGLTEGIFDVGILSRNLPEQLAGIPIGTDRTILIAPVTDENLQLQGSPDALERLMHSPMILREFGGDHPRSIDHCFREMNIREEDLDIVARINDQETIKRLVAGGVGVSLISARAADDYVKEKRVLPFELPFPDSRPVWLAYRKDYYLRSLFREFADFLQKAE